MDKKRLGITSLHWGYGFLILVALANIYLLVNVTLSTSKSYGLLHQMTSTPSRLIVERLDRRKTSGPGLPVSQPSNVNLSQLHASNISSNNQTKPDKENDEEFPPECASWFTTTRSQPYYLTAVLLMRIYETDKAKLTTRELKQWLLYLRYTGVEHVYLYDAFMTADESQKDHLTSFFQDSFITYVDWHTHNPYTIDGTQVTAYQHCIDNYGRGSQWQVAIDIDEYPFSPQDTKAGFLPRIIREISLDNPAVTEISMQNYLFLGKPLDVEYLFGRIWRRTPQRSNALAKPIYQPVKVMANVHYNMLKSGTRMSAPDDQLRMNHYWGARLQDWGDDTPEILGKTMKDISMEAILNEFRRCDKLLRRYLD